MTRLTITDTENTDIIPLKGLNDDVLRSILTHNQYTIIREAARALQAYENQAEHKSQQMLNIGDYIYADSHVFDILKYRVNQITITSNGTFIYECFAYSEAIGDNPSELLDALEITNEHINKIAFFTYEEAFKHKS